MNRPSNPSRNFLKPYQGLLLVAVLCFLTGCVSTNTSRVKTGKHLFILSGQSNMTGTLKDAFADRVRQHWGEENATVVIRMKSGRGIRYWVKDYETPASATHVAPKHKANGSEYPALLQAATDAMGQASFDTVGFIWMQGESDGLNRLSEAYEASFIKLLDRLKKDLDRDDMYFVIGRISDFGLNQDAHDHWQRVREAQVNLGQRRDGAWIDTDDLNGGSVDHPHGELHYPKQGSEILGQRFAEKAIEMSSLRSSE